MSALPRVVFCHNCLRFGVLAHFSCIRQGLYLVCRTFLKLRCFITLLKYSTVHLFVFGVFVVCVACQGVHGESCSCCQRCSIDEKLATDLELQCLSHSTVVAKLALSLVVLQVCVNLGLERGMTTFD